MPTLTTRLDEYVDALNAADRKTREAAVAHFGRTALGVGSRFVIEPGRKYAKIVAIAEPGDFRSVHAFVDDDGNVYKPAGWARPARGVRFRLPDDDSFTRLLAAVDPFGGYLYARRG